MRILVTGGAGMLGSAVVPEMVRCGHQVAVTDLSLSDPRPWGATGPTVHRLDVRRTDDIDEAFDAVRPELVIHLAAETDLERCENAPDAAFHTNTIGTHLVALACQGTATPLVYISTAGVFDGTKTSAYDEYDRPNPINVYGRSKYEGELIVEQLLDRFWIVRAGWMVGGGAKDHKFVARILQQLDAGASTIYAVGDKFGTPTYAPDFARCLSALVSTGRYGRYHMACEGWATRYDVAARILAILGREDVDLIKVGSEHFAEEFYAPRPRSEIMRNLALELHGLNGMRSWETAIESYLRGSFPHLSIPEGATARS